MTIEKPIYEMPSGTDAKSIEKKLFDKVYNADIDLPEAAMAKVTPSQYEYILQRYADYVANDGKLDFKSYVIEFFDKDFKFKKGGIVK